MRHLLDCAIAAQDHAVVSFGHVREKTLMDLQIETVGEDSRAERVVSISCLIHKQRYCYFRSRHILNLNNPLSYLYYNPFLPMSQYLIPRPNGINSNTDHILKYNNYFLYNHQLVLYHLQKIISQIRF